MKKSILLLSLSVVVFACGNETTVDEEKSNVNSTEEKSKQVESKVQEESKVSAFLTAEMVKKSFHLSSETEVSISGDESNSSASWVNKDLPNSEVDHSALLLISKLNKYTGTANDMQNMAEAKSGEYIKGLGDIGGYYIKDNDDGNTPGLFFVLRNHLYRIYIAAYKDDVKMKAEIELAKELIRNAQESKEAID